MDYICDKLIEARANTCIPAFSDRVITVHQNLCLPLKVYTSLVVDKEMVETATSQVQQQYRELMAVLEGLLCSRALRDPIQIEETYRKLDCQEYIGPYSPQNFIQII